jgi:hypothetical protein
MTDPVPSRVALYANNTGEPRRVAYFHWSPDDGVRLELLDQEWSRVAKQYYERGVELPAERRMVLPAEGPVFMRALLQPFRMSYYSLRDESR